MAFHRRTVQQRLVALDVGRPQTIGTVSANIPVHQIRDWRPVFGPAGGGIVAPAAIEVGLNHSVADRLAGQLDHLLAKFGGIGNT